MNIKLEPSGATRVSRMYGINGVIESTVKNCFTQEMTDGRIVQTNKYHDGSWDVWVVLPAPNDADRDCFCVAASFQVPDRHFNE